MKSAYKLAWLDCAALGCEAGTAVDLRHVDNLTAAGGWLCREHERDTR